MSMAIHSWKWKKLKLGKMSFNKLPAELHGILTTEYYSAIKRNERWNFKDMWNPSGHWQRVSLKGMYAVRFQWPRSATTNWKDSTELRSRRARTRKKSTGTFRPEIPRWPNLQWDQCYHVFLSTPELFKTKSEPSNTLWT